MSGLEVPKKNSAEVAEIVYLLHGANSDDPKFSQGLKSILQGVTSSHAGALIRFTDPELFDKYIKDSGIPYSISQDNQKTVYEVEVNFGPEGNVGLGDSDKNGILYSQIEACLSTNLLSPVLLTDKGKKLLDDKNVFRSKIFPLTKTRDIGITTAIHYSLIPDKFKQKSDLKTIYDELDKFAKAIEAAEAKHLKKPQYSLLMSEVTTAIENLRQQLDSNMPIAQFKGEIDKFITIGKPPEQSITIPLTTNRTQSNGLPLESMLQFLVDKKNATPYNLLLNNCAHYLGKLFKYAAKDNQNISKKLTNRVFSEENILGWVASVVSPHGNAKRFDPPDVYTPVIMARKLLTIKEGMHKQVGNENVDKTKNEQMNLRTAPKDLQPRVKIKDDSLNTNYIQHGSPRYILDIYTTIQRGNTLDSNNKTKVNIFEIANTVSKKLNAKLGEEAFHVVQEDNKTFILDNKKQALIAIENYKDQIHVTCYHEHTNIDEFLAKAIHEHINLNINEELNFNIISKQDVPAYDNIYTAIKNAYSDLKQIHINNDHRLKQ